MSRHCVNWLKTRHWRRRRQPSVDVYTLTINPDIESTDLFAFLADEEQVLKHSLHLGGRNGLVAILELLSMLAHEIDLFRTEGLEDILPKRARE